MIELKKRLFLEQKGKQTDAPCDLCQDFLLGDLNEEKGKEFVDHLADCMSCTNFVASILLIEEQLLKKNEINDSDGSLTEQVLVRVRAAGGRGH